MYSHLRVRRSSGGFSDLPRVLYEYCGEARLTLPIIGSDIEKTFAFLLCWNRRTSCLLPPAYPRYPCLAYTLLLCLVTGVLTSIYTIVRGFLLGVECLCDASVAA